jgi:hypothetical protein
MILKGGHIRVAVSVVLVSKVISCWIPRILILDRKRQYLSDEQHYLFMERYIQGIHKKMVRSKYESPVKPHHSFVYALYLYVH